MIVLLLLFLLFSSITANASEHFSDHESYCLQKDEQACLALLKKQSDAVPLYSKAWFKLTSYKLDYYYDKREFKKLEQTIVPLLVIENKPDVFELQLNYYYSKTLAYFGKRKQAKHYAQLAISKLEKIYHIFEDPMRMVEIANLEYVFGDRQKAYQLLLLAENKFGKRGDPVFHLELHTNKGHIFFIWQNYERAAKFYKLALDWIKDTEHDAKKVVAYSNLARTYQLMNKHELALEHFRRIEELLLKQNNPRLLALTLIRTAEVYEQLNELDKLAQLMARINFGDLSHGYHETYERLVKLTASNLNSPKVSSSQFN
ncbi:tetratricopeptide repeat protein [Pseudoalteromonas sp. SS15]|uniref:tetratricopeptide repeat protein n=1 Tax=Pseudoalteromonas sp. SS15 TaxID=3139393 RepID=UPI003BAA43DF